jgi:hypothetical protein
MGNPVGRVPGPTGADIPAPIRKILGFLRDLTTEVDVSQAIDLVFDLKDSRQKIKNVLREFFPTEGGGSFQPGEASNRDPTPATLPIFREGDSRRDIKNPGTSLTTLGFRLEIKDIQLTDPLKSPDVFANGTATIHIPTDQPNYDTPTDIPIYIQLDRLDRRELDLSGYARAFQVVRAEYKLKIRYDSALLFKRVIQIGKKMNISRSDLEQLASTMSLDLTSTLRLGPLPLSLIKLSADSLVPLKHPLIGATDDIIPVQAAALSNHTFKMGGMLLIPKGVFFDFNAPGLGYHGSWFRGGQGLSFTAAGLAIPNLSDIGDPSLYGYLDVGYSRRVTDSLDLKVGVTATVSPFAAPGAPDPLQLQYLQAASKSWLPTSEENMPPGQDPTKYNVMFSVKGVFDAL